MMKISGICCSSGMFWNQFCRQSTESPFPCPGGAVLPGAGANLNLDICCVSGVSSLRRGLRRASSLWEGFPLFLPFYTFSPRFSGKNHVQIETNLEEVPMQHCPARAAQRLAAAVLALVLLAVRLFAPCPRR